MIKMVNLKYNTVKCDLIPKSLDFFFKTWNIMGVFLLFKLCSLLSYNDFFIKNTEETIKMS